MPPRLNPKYPAPKSHFARRPPPTPAPAYTAPLQWTPPSSPAPPNMPLPNLPPYSLPEPEPPALRWSPLEGPSSRPNFLPTFRANQPPRRYCYLRHETLLLAVLLILQLAVLVILGTVLTHSDWRRCGDGLTLP